MMQAARDVKLCLLGVRYLSFTTVHYFITSYFVYVCILTCCGNIMDGHLLHQCVVEQIASKVRLTLEVQWRQMVTFQSVQYQPGLTYIFYF